MMVVLGWTRWGDAVPPPAAPSAIAIVERSASGDGIASFV
eukprot:CAMPEP_0178706892 /NCGR_PEP_ID=MMETSP0699-20121125/15676_1 /TAXON_ID=265572 /ORGANISM="Extubocellulus spinifer, Strain CCMP396" /LENGTH=39 /DNA_ID= /DNA_START= /DNA_END= /DNA_ORIENTATION=